MTANPSLTQLLFPHLANQSEVEINRDTVLSLVGIMVLLRQLSYAIKTQLKAPKSLF